MEKSTHTRLLIIAILSLLAPLAQAGYFSTAHLWPSTSVRACFALEEEEKRELGKYVLRVRKWKSKHKALLQKWVSEEFSSIKTGIEFEGFEDCDRDPSADLVIFFGKKRPLFPDRSWRYLHGQAIVGSWPGSVSGFPAAQGYVFIASSGVTKGTVIHEFGHSAGLFHEHEHPHANPKDCRYVSQKTHSNTNFTSYDPESIMSYCVVMGPEGETRGLSRRDALLLKQLYSRR